MRPLIGVGGRAPLTEEPFESLEEVGFGDEFHEGRLGDGLEAFGVELGEEELAAVFGDFGCAFAEEVQGGGVDRDDLVEPQDDLLRPLDEFLEYLVELGVGAEEKGPLKLEDLKLWRNLEDFGRGVVGGDLEEIALELVELCCLGHPIDEKECREEDAHLDRRDEVEEDGESKGGEEDREVGSGRLIKVAPAAPFRHVVGDEHQNRSQGCHRNENDHVFKKKNNDEKKERVSHPGYRSGPACTDVRGRSCDRTGDRNPSKKGRKNVANPLRNQLGIGAMPFPKHPVSNESAKKRFNPAQQRDCERCGEQLGDSGQR